LVATPVTASAMVASRRVDADTAVPPPALMTAFSSTVCPTAGRAAQRPRSETAASVR